MSIHRWLNWPYRKARTLSPAERVLTSADSQPPVPVPGKMKAVPSAVYQAHVRKDSRNRAASAEVRLAAHRAIAEANGVAS